MTDAITSPAHTPGPWTFLKNGLNSYSVQLADASPLASVGDGVHDGAPDGMVEANARLIAAAPDLLEACRGICAMIYRDKNGDERIDLDQYEKAERLCRRAIIKANGQA